jgi:hypothetical protein
VSRILRTIQRPRSQSRAGGLVRISLVARPKSKCCLIYVQKSSRNRGFDVFRRWFEYQHHSGLIDISDEPLIRESDCGR